MNFSVETMQCVETIKNMVEAVAQLCVAASLIFASFKWNKGQKTTKARYLKVLIGEYNKDSIQDFCLNVRHHSESESRTDADDPGFEKNMRKTLLFFSYLCHAYNSGLINRNEFSFFESQIERVVKDARVKCCLKQSDSDYSALLKMARKRKWLEP